MAASAQVVEEDHPGAVMADYAATVGSRLADSGSEIIIDAISQNIASVRVYSSHWVDFLHLVKARGDWKLLHVTWHERGRPVAAGTRTVITVVAAWTSETAGSP